MSQVRPVPEGQHTITPHVMARDARKAIEFYRAAFGAEERVRIAAPDGRIMHAELQIGDSRIYVADGFSPAGALPEGIVLHLSVPNCDELWERALRAGATVKMPLENAFWGDRYGQLVDPFGHTWSVATHVEDVAPDEVERRAKEVFAKRGA